jgi:hypothetical protein
MTNVRFGITDIEARRINVRFTPKSGHRRVRLPCPLCATCGHKRSLVVRLDYVFEPTHVLCADCPESVCSDERRCLLPKPMSARRSGRPLPPLQQIRRSRTLL